MLSITLGHVAMATVALRPSYRLYGSGNHMVQGSYSPSYTARSDIDEDLELATESHQVRRVGRTLTDTDVLQLIRLAHPQIRFLLEPPGMPSCTQYGGFARRILEFDMPSSAWRLNSCSTNVNAIRTRQLRGPGAVALQ